MTLGNLVKKYRENHNISMDEFSKMCNLSKGYISMLENNTNPRNNKPIAPTLPTINKIASAMNVDLDSILKAMDSNQEINLDSKSKKSTEVADFLKQLRRKSGLSASDVVNELQKYNIDISAKTLYGYESGLSMLNADAFVALCRIYKCDNPMDMFGTPSISSKEYNLVEKYRTLDIHGKDMINMVLNKEAERMKELEAEPTSNVTPMRFMSYYQRMASAGSGEYLFDDIPTDLIEVEDTPLSQKADFVLGVNGRSMEPTYNDGDNILVRKTSDVPIGHIGVFIRGNHCYIKELGEDRLISHNEDKETYPDIYPDDEPIGVVGEVLGKI